MKLPVLNYHGIESRPGEYDWLGEEIPYVVSADIFSRQMDEILKRGYRALNLEGVRRWGLSRGAENEIMITFDDGMISQAAHAAPILKSKGLSALFFVPALLVGEKGFMDWSDLRELIRQGFEIGSHGLRHLPLTGMSADQVWEEFDGSRKMLEEKLQAPVKSFSIPRGFYKPSMRALARRAGYEFLFTSSFDVNEAPLDPFHIKRLVVKKMTTPDAFSHRIQGELGFSRQWEKMKESVRSASPSWFYDGLAALKRTLRKS